MNYPNPVPNVNNFTQWLNGVRDNAVSRNILANDGSEGSSVAKRSESTSDSNTIKFRNTQAETFDQWLLYKYGKISINLTTEEEATYFMEWYNGYKVKFNTANGVGTHGDGNIITSNGNHYNVYDPFRSYNIGELIYVDTYRLAGFQYFSNIATWYDYEKPIWCYPGLYICVSPTKLFIEKTEYDKLSDYEKVKYRNPNHNYAPVAPNPYFIESEFFGNASLSLYSGNMDSIHLITKGYTITGKSKSPTWDQENYCAKATCCFNLISMDINYVALCKNRMTEEHIIHESTTMGPNNIDEFITNFAIIPEGPGIRDYVAQSTTLTAGEKAAILE